MDATQFIKDVQCTVGTCCQNLFLVEPKLCMYWHVVTRGLFSHNESSLRHILSSTSSPQVSFVWAEPLVQSVTQHNRDSLERLPGPYGGWHQACVVSLDLCWSWSVDYAGLVVIWSLNKNTLISSSCNRDHIVLERQRESGWGILVVGKWEGEGCQGNWLLSNKLAIEIYSCYISLITP